MCPHLYSKEDVIISGFRSCWSDFAKNGLVFGCLRPRRWALEFRMDPLFSCCWQNTIMLAKRMELTSDHLIEWSPLQTGNLLGRWLASSIRGELGYAHWPRLGYKFIALLGTKLIGPIRARRYCPNFALTATKFMLSNSGNFRAKANTLKPRSSPKCPVRQCLGPNSSADWARTYVSTWFHRQDICWWG